MAWWSYLRILSQVFQVYSFCWQASRCEASAFKDHARTEKHKCAMLLFKKSQTTQITQYAPIAKVLSMN